MMDSPDNTMPFSATDLSSGPQTTNPDRSNESLPSNRTDRLYQIAAVNAGLILLFTAL
jgi:hypothetical protein